MSTPTGPKRGGWPAGSGVGLGVIVGAALGLTIFDNVVASTGIGLVIGAMVDLTSRRRQDRR